ncbi:ATP-binding protein [Pseudoduganella namucuonensis]|uniref:Virulence sensor protein BvgS n=1 Tax=Pseudoduganella namucuonensis TaxID=1035707 RepID=A0A1I7JPE7_9BURK|nr:ATP-binding protein [Pseudoduganella namucuonensis]SFU87035.1 PAS domain S-box-containing protein [Pseudoduganella namucuonensis]
MNFGIKRKLLLVLAGVLAFSGALDALLASYYTRQQNQESAFAGLGRDLLAWQNDLRATTVHMRKVAVAAVGDLIVLRQLAELEVFAFQFAVAAKDGPAREQARTLGYGKSVSLNRLSLVLRTGGYSSIAVYSRGELSHYVSEHEAGMALPRGGAGAVWLSAPADAGGNLPTREWPAWREDRPPADIARQAPRVAGPQVSFSFPTPDSSAIEVAVPVQGQVIDYPAELEALPERAVTQVAIAGLDGGRDNVSAAGTATFATVVFRKRIDQAHLRAIAGKTGHWPAIFSPDGAHQQQLPGAALPPRDWGLGDSPAGAGGAGPSAIRRRSVDSALGPYYVALLPWQFEGQRPLLLGMAASRVNTMHNVRQTVTGILAAAGLTMALSIAIGVFWLGRIVNPILRLTAAVKDISRRRQATAAMDGQNPADYLRPLAIEAGDEIGDLGAAFNVMIAEHRQAFETLELRVQARTAELRQQTRYLRALIDTLPLVAWIKDADGNYLAANQATADACGRGTDEMVGLSDFDLWPRALALQYRADDADVMASGRPKTVEEALSTPNGTYWIETFKGPVLDEDGTVLGTVGAARDISERKAAEAARDAALHQATRLARLRSEFIAQMSHELRTPLNAILGYAQILRRDRRLTEQQANGLATIQESGQHLLALINDILDLSRIESEKLELSLAEVNLPGFLQVVADIIRVKADEKGLLFTYDGAALPPSVRLDSKRLRQILLNLLGNAVKFTDRGEVVLRVRRGAPTSDDATARLRFEVRDSGIGMDAEQRSRLFQPFEQVSAPERREGGAGLGLVISRQLVRLMGGEITVESEPGRGSLFWFELTLPCGPGRARPSRERLNATGYEGARRKVLVVDDMRQNRAMLVDLLTMLGFDTTEAANGLDALGVAARVEPDLIMMDLMMPVMDGLETTRRIRLLPGTLARVPIVIVTASASQGDEANSLAAGASAFVAKPIEQEVLLRTLEAQLGLRWVYEAAPAPEDEEDGEEPEPPPLPPPEEMAVLHRLALTGNMRKIRQHADHLKQLDPRYAWLARRLHSLAANYQSKAIVALVERYLES